MGLRFANWITGLGVALVVAGSAFAQGATPDASKADAQAIREVIRTQIEAFQQDDGPAAFALASPSIQAQFGSAENFMRRVRDGYAPVYRPRTYRFLELSVVEGALVQKVALIGPDGLAVLAVYPMVKVKDGTWRTNGCYLIPMESKSA